MDIEGLILDILKTGKDFASIGFCIVANVSFRFLLQISVGLIIVESRS